MDVFIRHPSPDSSTLALMAYSHSSQITSPPCSHPLMRCPVALGVESSPSWPARPCLALVPAPLHSHASPSAPATLGTAGHFPPQGLCPLFLSLELSPQVFSCLVPALLSCLYSRLPGSGGGWQSGSCFPALFFSSWLSLPDIICSYSLLYSQS